MNKLQLKWLGVLGAVALAIFLLYPTINWYSQDSAERAKLEAFRLRPKWLLNLGLDLKGGTHLLMELDVSKLDSKADINDAIKVKIKTAFVSRPHQKITVFWRIFLDPV